MITLDRHPPAPAPQPMGNYKSVGKTIEQSGYTEAQLQAVRLADLEHLREVILAEAAEWPSERRVSIWSALIIIAKKCGITITRAQCEAALRAKHPEAKP